jgi:hypothetical protein
MSCCNIFDYTAIYGPNTAHKINQMKEKFGLKYLPKLEFSVNQVAKSRRNSSAVIIAK